MKKKIFNEVQKFMCQFSTKEVQGHALKRINTMSGLVSGMISAKSCSLNNIGSGIDKDINAQSKEIAASRFLENKNTDYKVHYLPYIKQFILGFLLKNKISLDCSSEQNRIYLAIDGSQMGSNYVCLMISLVVGKRSIPIFWVVKEGKKGHFPTEMHLEVIQGAIGYLRSFLGDTLGFILLGDGEFDSCELQKLCQEIKIDYVLRTSKISLMYEDGEEFQPYKLHLSGKTKNFFIPDIAFSKEKLENVNFLYWFDQKLYENPLYLVSSLDNAPDIMFAYRKRFAIETLFKDFKSRGFNLHKTRITHELSIINLIMVACLAFYFLMDFGYRNENNPLKIKVQRIDKNVNSIFSFAQAFLQYLCDENLDFSFAPT